MKMKNARSLAVMLIAMLALLISCKTNSISKNRLTDDSFHSKENGTTCFIVKNNGETEEFNTLKLVTGPFSTPYLFADGKKRIKASEIIAYQNKDHYAVSQKTFCCGRVSHVATVTLPGFAIRITKGRLNVYCKKYFNGQVAVDEFFLQAGLDGKIMEYSPKLMNELVNDNNEAYNYFNDKKTRARLPEKIETTARLYNGEQLVSKN
jgi:hypothetical protein